MVLPLEERMSPGRPMTRFTRSVTGSLQSFRTSSGALKTNMSPMLILPNSTLSLSTRMRLPVYNVGFIEGDGIKNVWKTYVRTAKETKSAAINTRSHSTKLFLRDLTLLSAGTSWVGSSRSTAIRQQHWVQRVPTFGTAERRLFWVNHYGVSAVRWVLRAGDQRVRARRRRSRRRESLRDRPPLGRRARHSRPPRACAFVDSKKWRPDQRERRRQ